MNSAYFTQKPSTEFDSLHPKVDILTLVHLFFPLKLLINKDSIISMCQQWQSYETPDLQSELQPATYTSSQITPSVTGTAHQRDSCVHQNKEEQKEMLLSFQNRTNTSEQTHYYSYCNIKCKDVQLS